MDPIQGMFSGIFGTVLVFGVIIHFLGSKFVRIAGLAIMLVGVAILMFTKSPQTAGPICFLGFIAFSLGGGKF